MHRTGPPVVSLVAKSGTGKTTFMEKLVAEMVARGWRVGTVKHHVHDYDIDIPGKDSWRHAQAGSSVCMISSPDKFSLVRNVEQELTLDELAEQAPDVDILLTEGYKNRARVRIEISRMERSRELMCAANELFGLVTDNPDLHPEGVPVFDLDDASGVADLIERTYLADRVPRVAADGSDAILREEGDR